MNFNPNLKIRLNARQKVAGARNALIGARAGNVEKGKTSIEIEGLPVFVTAHDTTGRRKKAYVTFVFGFEVDAQTHGVAVEMRLEDISQMCHALYLPVHS